MVTTRTLLIMLLAIAFPALAFAGDFTAKTDRTTLSPGESFTLELTLSGGREAKGPPDTQPLEPSFVVESEGQSVSTSVINGKVDTTYGWTVVLAPRTEGKIVIPPLTIQTASGALSTEPITVEVAKGAAPTTIQGKLPHISITASANTVSPYKGQLVLYTVKIVAPGNVVDVSLDNLTVDKAIVENPPKHRIYDSTENGIPVKVIEVHYMITPLVSGRLTIPSVMLRGKMQVAGRDSLDDIFSQMDNDPFGMMPRMPRFGGFAQIKPFSLASNEVHLDVRPPAATMDPWLPLASLTISQTWEGVQNAKVGEPVTRRITLVADGGVGKALPSLEAQQNHTDFNVYADKPVTEDNTKGATIVGTRKESYSLIPLKPGKLVLPEIRVPWWDLRTNRIAYAELPPTTLDVLPAPAGQSNTPSPPSAQPAPQQPTAAPAPAQSHPLAARPQPVQYSILYTIIGILLLALLYAIAWALRAQKNALRPIPQAHGPSLAAQPDAKPTRMSQDVSGLAAVKSVPQLHQFLRDYAAGRFGAPANASLEEMFALMPVDDALRQARIADFIAELSGALYGGKEANIEGLKEELRFIISSLKHKSAAKTHPSDGLARLNPT